MKKSKQRQDLFWSESWKHWAKARDLSNWYSRGKSCDGKNHPILSDIIDIKYTSSFSFYKRRIKLVVQNPKASKGKIESAWSSESMSYWSFCFPSLEGSMQAEWSSPTNHEANCEWKPVGHSTERHSLSALICGFPCSASDANNEYSFHCVSSSHLSPNIAYYLRG